MDKLKLIIYIGKWLVLMMLFIVSSISMIYGKDPQGIWTAMWCLIIVTIVDFTDREMDGK